MLGFRYLKATPTTHVLHYHKGKLVHDGVGLSFWYFSPTAVVAQVPVSSRDVPFVFNEVTSDFQDVAIQGELTNITDGQLTFTNTPYVRQHRPSDNRDRDRDRGGYGDYRNKRGQKFQGRGGRDNRDRDGGGRNDRKDRNDRGGKFKKRY